MGVKMDRRTFLRIAGACPALALAPISAENHRERMFAVGQLSEGPEIVLSGEYGYEQKNIRNLPVRAIIDARNASFTVANSRNSAPNAFIGCDMGWQPINRYPLVIRNCPGVHFIGGRFDGQVPLTTDWRHTYCNSAAMLVRDGTSHATIEGVRARRCWDGVRFIDHVNDFRLRGSWLSEIRDDAVENDYLASGVVEDCLFDGCFSGISLDPGSREGDGRQETVTIDRSLIRMGAYLAKGEITHQAPVKAADVSPRLKITETIFALTAANMRGFRRLERTWARMIESRDNALLWLPDEPIPAELPLPRAGFALHTGADARECWDKARRQWITSHPDVPRFPDDEP